MSVRRSHLAWSALLGLISGAPLLEAGSFRVAPVRIDLSARRPHSTLSVSNNGTERVTVQAEAFVWRVERDEDRLNETDDVLVNPPIFTLEPGATQLLRLGLREWISSRTEQTYRIVLEEVPPPRRPTEVGIRTLLRLSIPLFIQPTGSTSQPDGSLALAVENIGRVHTRLRQFSVTADDQPQGDFVMSVPTYVLAGTRRQWTFDGARIPHARELHVNGQTEGAELHATAPIQVR